MGRQFLKYLFATLRSQENNVFSLCNVVDMLRSHRRNYTSTRGPTDQLSSSAVHSSLRNCLDQVFAKLQRDTQERLAFRAETFVNRHLAAFKADRQHPAHKAYLESSMVKLRRLENSTSSTRYSEKLSSFWTDCIFVWTHLFFKRLRRSACSLAASHC